MDASDFVTLIVGIVAGLGSGLGSTMIANRRADKRAHDADNERMYRALRNYELVLSDVSSDMEESAMGAPGQPLTSNYQDYIAEARSEAVHYFGRFTEKEQQLLKWPIMPYQGGDPFAPSEHAHAAAKVIQRHFESLNGPSRSNSLGKRWFGA